MRIDILHFDDCPNHVPAAALAREVAQALGVVASVRAVLIRDADEAQALRFLGSPTIHVDGLDIEPGARDRTDFGLACRLYGRAGIPERETLVAAIREALGRAAPPAVSKD